jgi:hypothetical protein
MQYAKFLSFFYLLIYEFSFEYVSKMLNKFKQILVFHLQKTEALQIQTKKF